MRGVSVAFPEKDKIAWAHGFGLKVGGGKYAVSVDTMFQAASISKSMTTTAMPSRRRRVVARCPKLITTSGLCNYQKMITPTPLVHRPSLGET
ncbi:MAG: hypothetical protein E6Q34_09135 [Burkholderiaceae bacterium]|nr:MAG: hypothetical protein E6Q34_09135 [Burkholderiaceae bacterium]